MEKIDAWLIVASLFLVFSLLFYLDHNEKRMVALEGSPYHIEKQFFQCEVNDYRTEDMTAGQLVQVLREVDKLVYSLNATG